VANGFSGGQSFCTAEKIFGLTTSDAVVANRQSPIAAIFGSAGASPSQLIPSLVPRPTTRFKSALSFLRHQLRTKVRLACKRASALIG